MKYQITIRTSQQLKSSKKEIVDALLREAKSTDKKEFPLFYKYLESKNYTNQPNENAKIGSISDIKQANNGDIIASVYIHEYKALSQHFTGVVDNLSVNIIASSSKKKKQHTPVLAYGIVYDKFAKQTINSRKRAQQNTKMHQQQDLPEADYVTQDKDNNPLYDPSLMKELHKLAEKELGKEN